MSAERTLALEALNVAEEVGERVEELGERVEQTSGTEHDRNRARDGVGDLITT